MLEQQGAEPAYRLVRDELRRSPTLLGLDKLLEAQLLEAPSSAGSDLELIKNLVHQHTRSLAMYKCDNCGFRARQYYWHCPACARMGNVLAAPHGRERVAGMRPNMSPTAAWREQ